MTATLHAVPAEPTEQPGERTRVCDISFRRDDEHEARVLLAWKRREHPAWSQHASGYRVEAA